MKDKIENNVLGTLVVDIEEIPEYPSYVGQLPFGRHGVAQLNIVSLEGATGDWSALIARSETLYPTLVEREPEILRNVQSTLLNLHRDSFGDEWKESSDKLAACLRLLNWNVFDDGTVELWYEGGAPFHWRDVNVNLDAELHVVEVRFDG